MIRHSNNILIFGVIIFLFSVPLLVKSDFYLHVIILVYFNIIFCLGLYFIMATGLLSLAQAAFMGIGAYSSALLVLRVGLPFWIALLAAGFVTMLVALFVGVVVLRLKEVYFALVTFSLNEFIRLIFVNWVSLFGGVSGVTDIPPPQISISVIGVSMVLDSRRSFCYLITLFVLLAVILIYRIMNSELGRVLRSIQDSELLSNSTGINIAYYKTLVFSIAGFMSGIGGSLFAHYLGYIGPQYFSAWTSFDFVVICVVGGFGHLIGPILGSIVLTPIPEFMRGLKEVHLILYGGILIICMLFLPRGLASVAERITEKSKLAAFFRTGNEHTRIVGD